MGKEARKRQQTHNQLLTQNPWCIYCGGTIKATTIEHMPPRIIFHGKHRPKGLEFSACDACNHGSRNVDQIAGFMSRLYPDAKTDAQRADVGRVIKGFVNNFPAILSELESRPARSKAYVKNDLRLPHDTEVLNASGPLLNQALLLFGAKCGFALHREKTGTTIPQSGGVTVRWVTNFQALTGDFPSDILSRFGLHETLEQGKWSVRDQFEYASAATETGSMSGHWLTFRQSFAIIAFAAMDTTLFEPETDNHLFSPVFRPGCLTRNLNSLG